MLFEHTTLNLLPTLESRRPKTSRCLRTQISIADCRSCQANCPRGAISLEPGPVINQELCSGCMLCEHTCPSGTFQESGAVLSKVLDRLQEVENPVLGCRREGVGAHARIACLGLLASPEVLLAVSVLLPEGLTLNMTHCRGCPNNLIVGRLQAALEQVADLPEQTVSRTIRFADCEADLSYRERQFSRRDFFSFFQRKSEQLATDTLNRHRSLARSVSYRDKNLPPERALLLQVLPRLPFALRQAIEECFIPNLSFLEGCQKCQGCVGICPTGALSPSHTDGDHPRFLPLRCTGCLLCTEFCRHKGISIELP